MTILEQEVWVKLNPANVKHYKDLKYVLPTKINSKGKIRINFDESILVKTEHLTDGSHVLITKICDDCSTRIENQNYGSLISNRKRGDGRDRCRKCSSIIGGLNRKDNMPYENSLEHAINKKELEYLLLEFSDKNIRLPNEISYGTGDYYLWNCPKCKSEYTAIPKDRMQDQNCPYCAGHKINHTNCIANTHPEVVNLLKDKEMGYKLTSQSDKKVDFVCPSCKREVGLKIVSNITNYGLSCHYCSDGISYPEKFISNLLYQLNIYFEPQKMFDWLKGKYYDFYIPSLNCIIETHGLQHYKENRMTRNLKLEQENDDLKNNMAIINKIDKYIVIDCSLSKLEFIKDSVFNSEISSLFHLDDVDWLECHRYACGTLVRDVSDYWNAGIINLSEIAKLVNLKRDTVKKYLKIGTELNWCEFIPYATREINAQKYRKLYSKPVIALTLDGNFYGEFESIKVAEQQLNTSNISAVCRGVKKSAGGFKWMYKSEYIMIINN